ncbi:ketopantoate reductase family protein [Fructobacillus ficulneus]|uniref:2-dehydropantoate 2-reductase n=1 Tax=Fructobacillus ficulneus TaxID=157463 RepID=A0A0K8MKX5_9LACO|nr:2-dehydropantoate 2-reductase [Fructobacillus ficulneus]GAP00535.1 ketopantoate reductase [Fructobacillus ficulneus]
MKYAVVGAGAMGLRYGLLLQENAGVEVDFVEPTKASLDAIHAQGDVVYRSVDHQDRTAIPVKAYSPEEYTGQPDVWIFFMKQMQLADTLTRLAPKFQPGQTALGAMNGMGHLEKFQQYFDDDHIIGGTAMIATILNDFGDVDFIGGTGSVYANMTEKPSEVMDQVQADFTKAELNPSYSENLLGTLLTKVAFNSVENSVHTMFQARVGETMAYPNYIEGVAKPMLDEAYAATKAAGIELLETEDEMLDKIVRLSTGAFAQHFPSMYQDFVKGRETEVDYINGYFTALADKHGVPAPTQKLVTNLVHLAEAMREFNPPKNKLAPAEQ